MVVALRGDTVVTLADSAVPAVSYRVSSPTLEALLSGSPAPRRDYEWTPFPFLLRVAKGNLVSAEQLWVP